MEIILLDELDNQSLANQLKHGKIMIYPTDTVAGIGSIGSEEKVVHRVFDAKQRSYDQPVSYAFSSLEMIKRYVTIPTSAHALFPFLPGPLTLILPRREDSPPLYGVDSDSIGVRIPDVSWLLNVIDLVEEPIITTSANRSGNPAARKVDDIDAELLDQVDILIEWVDELEDAASTVVSCLDELKILREGLIPESEINDRLN